MIILDKKIIAIAVVAVIIVAAAAVVVFSSGDKEDDTVSIVGRISTDGSGLYVKEGIDASKMVTIVNEEPKSGAYLGGNGTWVVFHKEAWGGMVIGDPGASTIQHVHLAAIVETMGLNFVQYTTGASLDKDTVYYVPDIVSYAKFVSSLATNKDLAGAIAWEPQYSVALVKGCTGVATTNQMFPGHTCCVVGANNSYLESHTEDAVRFLAGYVESVEKMSAALKAGSGEAYDEVLKIAKDRVTLPDGLTDAEKEETMKAAFKLVVYKYADTTDKNAADPLSQLKSDIVQLSEDLYKTGQMKNDYKALGFATEEEFGDKFVQSQYMKSAMNLKKDSSYETVTVSVAYIGGAISQLALHYGIALGIFESYGVNVELNTQASGPGVYTAINNGSSQFGLIGAPPMTINAMNSESVKP